MVAVHEKNGNTQGFQTPEPVAQGELGGDAGVLLIVHVPGEEQEIRALALAQIEEAAKRGERGCAQAFREIGGDVPGQAGKRGVQMKIRSMDETYGRHVAFLKKEYVPSCRIPRREASAPRYPGLVLIKRSPAFSKDFFTTRRPVRFDISSVSLHSDLFVLAARGLRRSCQPSAPINLRSSIMSDTIESTVMAEPEASSSSAILTGMKRGFPIFLGYVPLGFAYGVLAVQNNIPAVYAVLFSLLVYAGAGQFIAVGLWGMGASVFSIVFTTFVINLRHVLMSAAVAPWFAPFTRFQQFIIGWGLTDEVFAMHSMAMATGEKARLPLVYAANFTSHSGWVLGTFIGAVAGDFLPDPKLFGLDYALPAMFLALLVPQCKERLYTLAAVLSALLSVILAMYDTGRWNVIIASVITSSIGALLVTHRDRNIDALRRKA